MKAKAIARLAKMGVIDKSNLNGDQKKVINSLSEAEVESLIISAGKIRASSSDPDGFNVMIAS